VTHDEMMRGLYLAAKVFTHHDRYGRDSVIQGKPDVFVVASPNGSDDIAVRIDGSYTTESTEMRGLVAYWDERVRELVTFLRTHRDEIEPIRA
jgi:hypothetical protein